MGMVHGACWPAPQRLTVIIMAAATPALAATVDVDGGTWSCNHGANTAWSNDKHPTSRHASSVKTGGTELDSGCTAKGKWSLGGAERLGVVLLQPELLSLRSKLDESGHPRVVPL